MTGLNVHHVRLPAGKVTRHVAIATAPVGYLSAGSGLRRKAISRAPLKPSRAAMGSLVKTCFQIRKGEDHPLSPDMFETAHTDASVRICRTQSQTVQESIHEAQNYASRGRRI